ncbi:enterochelin esterase [Klebsiella sp. BIGb0407]|uniref:enterochelin esterase n=1 Tax=Klebsiella sp. BIGb0407 TaxID=2940603 RepID=UPI002168E36E|nr:enterochelin esterase [Klebsiella sp. BIGb0407]MCS3433434.1 enterochelin esterase family protein [Klebsiella sp. BIGb0407]
MTISRTGSEAWWASKQGPALRKEGEAWRVTFWWRDRYGTEQTSPLRHVWLCITGITDHHHHRQPLSLSRIPDSDIWSAEILLPAQWRGSYCFIPSQQNDDFAASVFEDPQSVRAEWQRLLPQAQSDPLNPLSWMGGRGHYVSGLEMPDAPEQPGWNNPDADYTPPKELIWQSTRLQNQRRVWVFTTGEADITDRPLAILLDGQFWAESMPVWPALSSLTGKGELPAAVYLLIDVIDGEHRSRELPCNPEFWQAVQEELLPLVAAIAPFSSAPERTIVAGQSFGGLASLYAGLYWPARFGGILAQSGSFWWPDRKEQQIGWLRQQLDQGSVRADGLRIILQAGKYEPLIFRANDAIRHQLTQATELNWCPFEGGHDAFCWRGGLTSGLIALWRPLTK